MSAITTAGAVAPIANGATTGENAIATNVAPFTSTADAGDTNTTTAALDGELLVRLKGSNPARYEKLVDQYREAGFGDGEITQAMINASGMISPGKMLPAVRGRRRAELAEHATEIRRLGKQAFEDVIEIGARLHACRAILKDDHSWRAWLKHELRLSPQSAGRLIQVHKLAQERSNLERASLPVSALYLLAAPSTPEEARTEVLDRAEVGEVSVSEVESVIKAHKAPAKRNLEKERTAREKHKRKRRKIAAEYKEIMATTDAEMSAEARKAAYAADEDNPAATKTAKPAAAAAETACEITTITDKPLDRRAAAALEEIAAILAEVERHPDRLGDIDGFVDGLVVKVTAFAKIAQRARGRGQRGGGRS